MPVQFSGTASDDTAVTVTLFDTSDCTGAPIFSNSFPHMGGGWNTADNVTRGENLTLSVIATQTNTFGFTGDSGCVPFATRAGIWVSALDGNDANPGTRVLPKATLQAGVNAASGLPGRVFAKQDIYTGTALALRSNVHVYGGFSGSSWTRPGIAGVGGSVDPSNTRFRSTTTEGAVAASDVNVLLDGLRIEAATGPTAGSSSYGLRAVLGSTVTLNNTWVFAGNGTNGAAGSFFGSSPIGGNGGPGGTACDNCSTIGAGGAGGVGIRGGGTGGGGGAQGGGDGQNGTFGDGGFLGEGGQGDPFGNQFACLGANEAQGMGGGRGEFPGPAAGGGTGASISLVLDAGTTWMGGSGGSGTDGTPGAAGGGGGGGAGDTGFLFVCDVFGDAGAGGGGGGAGGAGGRGGGAGGAGGASFGVYVIDSTVTISQSRIFALTGGSGGSGGNGGAGGRGGNGGAGGSCGTSTGVGGDGGGSGANGGNGGAGGGGGAAGGPSIAVFEGRRRRHEAPSTSRRVLAVNAGGSAGVGGAGGGGGNGGAAPAAARRTPSMLRRQRRRDAIGGIGLADQRDGLRATQATSTCPAVGAGVAVRRGDAIEPGSRDVRTFELERRLAGRTGSSKRFVPFLRIVLGGRTASRPSSRS
ncbi:MAG: hypothetical protein R2695_19480 [Acidimicrobiales bacterium]